MTSQPLSSVDSPSADIFHLENPELSGDMLLPRRDGNMTPLGLSARCESTDSGDRPSDLTLRAGLERYYQANPDFVRNQDLWVGWIRIPWSDLQRHDLMHVVTGYSTDLDDELQLIGFLLTAISWRRPWYYYLQSFGVFLQLLGMSLQGKAFGKGYYNPLQVCQLYVRGVRQGFTVHHPINAYIDPETVLDRSLFDLRKEYGIANAGAWD